MNIEDLNLDVRTYNTVRRAGFATVEELRQRMADDPERIRLTIGSNHFDSVMEALKGVQEQATVIVSENYTKAVTLTRSIIANAQAAQQSLYEVCKGLKEMRDGKLYKELGYQNFEDYTENEVGIKKVQAYKYVAIATNLTSDFVHSSEQIGTTKLALLARLDEPTREVLTEQVDVENVTVKELRHEIERITSENADLGQKLDAANEQLGSKKRQFDAAMESKEAQLRAVKESGEKKLSDCREYLNGRILALEQRIREMESVPIDHEMSDADAAEEITRLKQELEDEHLRIMQMQKIADTKTQKAVDEARHKLTQVHEQELETLRDGYEKQLSESKKPDRSAIDRGKFYALKTIFEGIVDELESLLDDLHDDPRIRYINELDNYWTDNLLYLKREGEGAGK